jgi:hypothetical protein
MRLSDRLTGAFRAVYDRVGREQGPDAAARWLAGARGALGDAAADRKRLVVMLLLLALGIGLLPVLVLMVWLFVRGPRGRR